MLVLNRTPKADELAIMPFTVFTIAAKQPSILTVPRKWAHLKKSRSSVPRLFPAKVSGQSVTSFLK